MMLLEYGIRPFLRIRVPDSSFFHPLEIPTVPFSKSVHSAHSFSVFFFPNVMNSEFPVQIVRARLLLDGFGYYHGKEVGEKLY